jgi:DNA-binding transcriptional regulator YdaS (Cro superfamily)
LFQILRFIGIDQKTLAETLHVTPQMVSMWKHGVQHIPRKHEQAILRLIRDQSDQTVSNLHQAWQDARKHAEQLEASHLEGLPEKRLREALQEEDAIREANQAAMGAAQRCLEFAQGVISLSQDCSAECLEREGILRQALYKNCRVLGHYGARQPAELTAEDRRAMHRATKIVQDSLTMLDRLEPVTKELAKPPLKLVAIQEEMREAV